MLTCTYTKENNINIENTNIQDVIKFLFNYKGFYFTIHNSKVIISDHPAKIRRSVGDRKRIFQIPMSYNGWLIWKSYIVKELEYLRRND